MKEGKDIDRLFREGLEHPDIPFNDGDWQALESRLHPEKRNRIPLFWFTAIGGVAAILLLVFFLTKTGDSAVDSHAIAGKVDHHTKGNPTLKSENPGVEDQKRTVVIADDKMTNKILPDAAAIVLGKNSKKNQQTDQRNPAAGSSLEIITDHFEKPVEARSSDQRLLTRAAHGPENLMAAVSIASLKGLPVQASIPSIKAEKIKSPVFKRNPRMVMSILAAPDLTSVAYSGNNSLSGSFGMEATVFITSRFSISTGLSYAKKIYNTDFSFYQPNSTYVFKNTPTNVHANCDVLDIPLNVNYKIFERAQNSISLSGGLSSYLMLKEKYSYTYPSGLQGPQSYAVRNQNQHYLGIANISVDFQHRLNNHLSIGIRPFVKLPLTNIGYGNMKLSSTGAAVTMNLNLFNKK